MIHKFVEKPIGDTPADCEMFRYYNRLAAGETLNRQEKDRLMDTLYGPGGMGGPTYRFQGWQCYFNEVLPAFIVQQFDLRKMWAPDAASIRKVMHSPIQNLYLIVGATAQELV